MRVKILENDPSLVVVNRKELETLQRKLNLWESRKESLRIMARQLRERSEEGHAYFYDEDVELDMSVSEKLKAMGEGT